MSIMANPEAWAAAVVVLLTPVLGWLLKLRADHKSCEVKLARIEAEQRADKERIAQLEGSVNVLTSLLKREAHLG